jgi:hypothetical protein
MHLLLLLVHFVCIYTLKYIIINIYSSLLYLYFN